MRICLDLQGGFKLLRQIGIHGSFLSLGPILATCSDGANS
jgi:hypothetical protein